VRPYLQPLPLPRRTLDDYEDYAELERIRAAAGPLQGARVAHLTAAGSRLGPLPALPALERDLGLETELLALAGDRPLMRLVQQLEDGLRGGETAISAEAWSAYVEATGTLLREFDVAVAHGPGPLGAAAGAQASVLRLPLEAPSPEPAMWELVQPLIGTVSLESDAPEAIDPLAPGCLDLAVREAGTLLRALGVDTNRPCCCQLRPFDGWQDPHAVVDSFALAKEEIPQLQLVLAGDSDVSEADGWRLLREVSDYAREREDVLALTGLGELELGALRRLARVAIECPLGPSRPTNRLEALWAGTPVIPAAADELVELVRDPGLAIELGAAGHELVRERHLVPRLLEDDLTAIAAARTANFQAG
jgi:trehalose synthase